MRSNSYLPKVNISATKIAPFKTDNNRVLFITEDTKEAFYKDVTANNYTGTLQGYRKQVFEILDLWGVPCDVITVTTNEKEDDESNVNKIQINIGDDTLIKESTSLDIYNDIQFLSVALSAGDTKEVVKLKIKEALESSEYFTNIYTISLNDNGVELKAKEVSSYLNNIGLSFSVVAGLTIDYTSTSASSTKAISEDRLKELTARYRGVISNYESIKVVSNWLSDRWNTKNDIKDGVAFTLLTAKPNEKLGKFVVTFYNPINGDKARQDYSLYSMVKFVAIRSYRLTEGRPLGNTELYEQPNRELSGGCHMATVPYFNTPLFNNIKECLTDSELLDYEDNLLTTVIADINPDIKSVTTQVFVSDDNYYTLNNIDALSCVREIVFDKLKRFKQMRLSDRVKRNQTITKMTVKAAAIEALEYSSSLALVRDEYRDISVANFSVDYEMGIVNFTISDIPLVSQLRAINGNLEFIL